jgi:predicted dehydrogenase
MSLRVSRRRFLQGTAAVASLTVLGSSFRKEAYAATGKLRIAYVGTNGQAGAHLGLAKNENCPCYCDPDPKARDKAAGMYPQAKAFTDYRKMIDEMEKDIDCVFIACPDNIHIPAAIRAMRKGKGVFVEKPAAKTVYEARLISDEVKKLKVPTQMGNQGHAGGGIRNQVAWVQAGVIGAVKETHTWTGRPGGWWPQGMAARPPTKPVPAGLDWDSWIGPAPFRDYHDGLNPGRWRGYYDFGTGAVGDMGCHTFDSVYWSMGMPTVLSVECIKADKLNKETFPRNAVYRWEFAATDKNPAFTGYWYEDAQKPPVPDGLKEAGKNGLGGSGSLLIGTKGFIVNEDDYSGRPQLFPASLQAEAQKAPKIEPSGGMHEELLNACKGLKAWDYPKSNFIYAGAICETLLLGNLATLIGLNKKLLWDSKNLKFTNNDAANEFVTRPYRKGWEL